MERNSVTGGNRSRQAAVVGRWFGFAARWSTIDIYYGHSSRPMLTSVGGGGRHLTCNATTNQPPFIGQWLAIAVALHVKDMGPSALTTRTDAADVGRLPHSSDCRHQCCQLGGFPAKLR